MGVGAVVIAKVNEAWRLPPFWGQETTPKTEAALCVFLKVLLGISKAEFDNLQAQVFEFWVEPSVGKVCLA